jgi:hypothetical protein
LIPVHPGFLTLEVYDLCLAFLGPATAHLKVSDIQELELDLIDKVRNVCIISEMKEVLFSLPSISLSLYPPPSHLFLLLSFSSLSFFFSTVILATQKLAIRRIEVQSQPGQIVPRALIS